MEGDRSRKQQSFYFLHSMILLNSLMHICVETRPIVHDGKMPFCQSLLKSKEHFPWRFANGTTGADREKGAD